MEEEWPTTLLDPECFIEIALNEFISQQPMMLEDSEISRVWTDGEIMERIAELTRDIDPLQWPIGYELDVGYCLASQEMGRLWVPPDEQLRQEILMAHHDMKMAGHLGVEGTLEFVGQKYWWTGIIDFTR